LQQGSGPRAEPPSADERVALGRRYHQAGRVVEAERLYREALEREPEHAEALHLLGVVAIQAKRYEVAVQSIGRATAADPSNADYLANLGMALAGAGRPEEAIGAYRRALALDPAHANAWYNLGGASRALGRLADAVEALEQAVSLEPAAVEVRAHLAALLLEQGAVRKAIAECERCLEHEPGNRLALGYKAMALDRLGDRQGARFLVDLERLIVPLRVAAPESFADIGALNRALAEHVRTHPTLGTDETGKATRFGHQTGDLLLEPKGPMAAFERLIHRAVAHYLARLPQDPAHPYLARAPRRWRLDVWGVVLDSQGHQAPHMHGDGWVSGVYYVALPEAVKAGGDQAGWIEFGRPPAELQPAPEPEVRRVRPEEGVMLLFPSYVHHRTVPFTSEEQRISIAFDAVPVGPLLAREAAR